MCALLASLHRAILVSAFVWARRAGDGAYAGCLRALFSGQSRGPLVPPYRMLCSIRTGVSTLILQDNGLSEIARRRAALTEIERRRVAMLEREREARAVLGRFLADAAHAHRSLCPIQSSVSSALRRRHLVAIAFHIHACLRLRCSSLPIACASGGPWMYSCDFRTRRRIPLRSVCSRSSSIGSPGILAARLFLRLCGCAAQTPLSFFSRWAARRLGRPHFWWACAVLVGGKRSPLLRRRGRRRARAR